MSGPTAVIHLAKEVNLLQQALTRVVSAHAQKILVEKELMSMEEEELQKKINDKMRELIKQLSEADPVTREQVIQYLH